MTDLPDIDQFRKEARVWLEQNAEALPEADKSDDEEQEVQWGQGSDNVAIFHNYTDEHELERLNAVKAWQRKKFDAGYAMINWPEDVGGRGLPATYVRAYTTEESKFRIPSAGELPLHQWASLPPLLARLELLSKRNVCEATHEHGNLWLPIVQRTKCWFRPCITHHPRCARW